MLTYGTGTGIVHHEMQPIYEPKESDKRRCDRCGFKKALRDFPKYDDGRYGRVCKKCLPIGEER